MYRRIAKNIDDWETVWILRAIACITAVNNFENGEGNTSKLSDIIILFLLFCVPSFSLKRKPEKHPIIVFIDLVTYFPYFFHDMPFNLPPIYYHVRGNCYVDLGTFNKG